MPSAASPDFASIPVVRLRIDASVWLLLVAALVGAGAAMAVMAWRANEVRSPERLRMELRSARLESDALVHQLLRMSTIDARDANLLLMRTLARMAATASPAAIQVYGTDAQDLHEVAEQLHAGEREEQHFRRWDELAQQGLDQWRRAERTAGVAPAPAWTQAQVSARSSSGPHRERMLRHRMHARRALMRLIERHWRPTAATNRSVYPGWPAPQAREILAPVLLPPEVVSASVGSR